ncbi:aromatic acid decarboxylase [Methanocella sp. CWC-04]|uniref:Flavin prenyltransferase UbiX n=1 Tax=Methanooceanicella nereidis TaxID=2052831 RepID=A0AAP2RDK8_9EURY|nr:UbiX family flavin prenyltransferase [Methanocella sp. CWC-04]MCD1295563.1 aromatic acid decarboxylase [Methanocella sp. CWC-04]
MQKRIVIAMTGASGVQYGIRLVEVLQGKAETHLVMSKHAKELIEFESDIKVEDLIKMASYHYDEEDFMAPIASGSYKFDAVVIVPCTMKTLSAIATGYAETLIARTADVALKEGRKLVLVPREMPLNLIHLENMVKVKQAGGSIMPACPGFYNRPKTIDDLIDNVVGRILDQIGIENDIFERWGEPKKRRSSPKSSSKKK